MRILTVLLFLLASILGTCSGVAVAARFVAQNVDPFCSRNPAACAAAPMPAAPASQPQGQNQASSQVVVPAPNVTVNPSIENKGQPIFSDTIQWVMASLLALLTGSHVLRTFKPTGNVKADLQALLQDPATKTDLLQALSNAVSSGVPGNLIQTAGASFGAAAWEPLLRQLVQQTVDARLGVAPTVPVTDIAGPIGDLVSHLKDLVAVLKAKTGSIP